MGYYLIKETGKWRVNVSVKGKGRATQTVDKETECEAVEKDLRQQLIDGVPQNQVRAKSQVTLKEEFEYTLNNPRRGWSKNGFHTAHGQKQVYYANSFYKFFGANKLLREIKLLNWDEYIKQYPDTNTNNRRACCMNSIFKNAFEAQRITSDNYLRIPRTKEKMTRVRVFSREEELAILQTCTMLGYLDLHDFVICLIELGCRPEELRTATPKDLQRYVDGKSSIALHRSKTDSDSILGLRKRTKEILIRRSNQERFFMSSYRVLYNKWNDVRDRLSKNDDVDWTFYTCRHTCASRLAEAGKTLAQIAEWLGHSKNSPVTRRYIHFFPKDAIKIADDMDKYEEKLSADNVRLMHGAKK